jgi:predicted transport protein
MFLFKGDKKLKIVKEKKISLEKEIQTLTEDNMNEIFGLDFVCTEFSLNNLRIDSLAFDNETNSFVIIEYKRDRSFTVIDQGFSYLALLINNKADFILEYNEKMNKNLNRGDIDWSQSRIIFIANSFTKYQKESINFKDLSFELWEFNKYEDNLISYNPIIARNPTESIKTIAKNNKEIQKVSSEIKNYTIEALFKDDWTESKELFEELREKVLNLDNRIKENPTKGYIGYKIEKNLLIVVHIQKESLRLELIRVDIGDLKDPENRINKIDYKKFKFGKMCKYSIFNSEDIDYAIFLIKQVYNKFYK